MGASWASMSPARRARRLVLQLAGLAGAVLGLTVLFLGMRSVMDIGGSCGSGGPYVVARPCPDNAWLVPVGIIGGLVMLAVYAFSCFSDGGPRLAALAWPALFLSLGWNFLEYAFDPPGDAGGPVIGWLVCGVVFWIMGGVPLLWVLRDGRALLWGPPSGAPPAGGRVSLSSHLPPRMPRPPPRWSRLGPTDGRPTGGPRPGPPGPAAPQAPRTASPDLVSRLERLDALRRSGALDDAEFERVKDELLREEGIA